MQKFSHYQVPRTKATLDDIYKNGNKIFLGNNEELVILNANSSEFFSVKDNNGKLSVNLNGLKLDEDGITSDLYYKKTNDNDFIQLKDLDKLKPYQKVVSSGGYDVSNVEKYDITVIFSDTTNEVATLTIPEANAANEGMTVTIIAFSKNKTLSETYTTLLGNGPENMSSSVKIKSINNEWYEIL